MGSMTEPLLTGVAPEATPLPSAKVVAISIVRAFSVYGLANLGIRALNFLLLPIYTRFLTPADYGVMVLAETLAAFLVSIVSLGFDASIQRLYFRHVDDSRALSAYVGSVLKFALLLEIAFLALAFAVGPRLHHALAPAANVPFLYIAMALATAVATQFFGYRLVLYQAERRPWGYAILSGLSFGLTASLTIALVVYARRGVTGMLGGKLIAATICLMVAVLLARHALGSHFHWAYVRETIAVGLPLVPHLLMAMGLVSADRFILAYYRDLREVGLYAIAYTLGMIMSLVTMSLSQAWAPIYYDMARKGEESSQVLSKMCAGLIVMLTAVACFGSLIAQDFVAHFLDHRYASAGRVVPWIIAAYLAHSLFSMFALAAMQTRRTTLIMGASFVALALNTVLNFALIPHWGMYGAAYATMIAYIVEALVMYWLAQRAFRLNYHLPRVFAAVAIFAAVLTVTQVHWSPSGRPIVMAAMAVVSLGLLSIIGSERVTRYLRLGAGHRY
ncbi:MAG: oligosaccharide flippase family protein [Candidatus Korobacteraceae bacterium]